MTRTRWALLLTSYAVGAFVLLVLLGGRVAPCLGGSIGNVSDACVDAWEARRSWLDRAFDTPLGALAVFGALTATTWLIVKGTGRRR